MASMGANWAVVALMTWDLAADDGPYTKAHRHELASPWAAVAPIPNAGE
jgi:hypothetical protein